MKPHRRGSLDDSRRESSPAGLACLNTFRVQRPLGKVALASRVSDPAAVLLHCTSREGGLNPEQPKEGEGRKPIANYLTKEMIRLIT